MDGGVKGMGRVCDWPEILLDFRRMGYSASDIGDALNIPATTVKSWAHGHEPTFSNGYRLVRLHLKVTGRSRMQDADRFAVLRR